MESCFDCQPGGRAARARGRSAPGRRRSASTSQSPRGARPTVQWAVACRTTAARIPTFDASSSAVRTESVTCSSYFVKPARSRVPDVSTPSPGPGWWLASDGRWYPQQWETTFISCTNESLESVMEEASRLTNSYREQGWEIVGSSMQRTQVAHRFKEYDRGGGPLFRVECHLYVETPTGAWQQKTHTRRGSIRDGCRSRVAQRELNSRRERARRPGTPPT